EFLGENDGNHYRGLAGAVFRRHHLRIGWTCDGGGLAMTSIAEIRTNHHALARWCAREMSNTSQGDCTPEQYLDCIAREIARIWPYPKMTPRQVRLMLNTPAFRELIAHYQKNPGANLS